MAFYGCLRDTPDDRDHRFGLSAPGAPDQMTVPLAHDLTAAFPSVMNQGAYNSCTAHSATAAFRYNLLNSDLPDRPLSRAQLYWDSGVIEGNTGDVGRQIRDVVKSIATKGVAREELWTYDKIGEPPPLTVYADAINQMALEYQRVDVTRQGINEVIFIGHPIVVGVNVYQEFESDEVAATGLIPLPRAGQTPIAAHSVLVGAYGPEGDTFLNSWDTWWGLPDKKGYGRFAPGYLEREGSDFWTLFINKETANVST